MTSETDTILNEAFSAYNTGCYDRAEGLCREVLSATPSNGDALFLLGLIAYQAGALEPAADLLFQAVKLYPDISQYDLTLASVLHRQGRVNEALTRYEKYPDNPQALAQRGLIYLQKNQPDFAGSAFKKALTLCPGLPEARLGESLLNNDDAALRRLAEETHLPDAWYYLAQHNRLVHHFKQALADIEQTGLGQGAYLLEKGLILEDSGNLNEALSIYRQASQTDPYHADIWVNQGNIYRKKKEYVAAEDAYKRALSLDSSHISARHNLADLLYVSGRTAESLEMYRAVLSQHPNYVPSLYNLAVILEKLGEYAEAAGLYVRLLLEADAPQDVKWRLADTLAALAETNKKLAARFAKGWSKNFPDDPVATHMQAAFTGQKEKDIKAYVQKLYDDFSDTYDKTMRHLQTHVIPELMAILPQRKYITGLDLGCGTGSFGRAIGTSVQRLIGVDLSKKMLQKAARIKSYTELIHEDALEYLHDTSLKFDLVATVEMLEYLPDLSELFCLVAGHLKQKGVFAFSVELSPKDKSMLLPNGRYCHAEKDICDLLKKSDLVILKQKEISLRKEGYKDARGMIIVAAKNTD